MTAPTVTEVDRHGHEVRIDSWGMRYATDETGWTWYLTDCCDASAKGSECGTVCRACYRPVCSSLGGIPDPV